jgi:hypothetical protein
MMADQTLILALRTPARLYLGDQGNADGIVLLDSVRTRSGFPPWPAAADLLVEQHTRQLCGVSYLVPPEYQVQARALATSLDPACVRYVSPGGIGRPSRYQTLGDQWPFLEIFWSPAEPTEVALAQLGGDLWYYLADPRTSVGRHPGVVGYGIGDLQQLLREYRLTLPERFTVPASLRVTEIAASERLP